jgi:ArsR family transcriptional regulator
MTPGGANARARATRLFHALSDETRLAVLERLHEGELCVCELQTQLGVAQSRLSFHLRVLREAGLVRDRKEGRWSYYRLNTSAIDDARDRLTRLGGEGSAVRPARNRAPRRVLRVMGVCCA